jgi:hypothetical protein
MGPSYIRARSRSLFFRYMNSINQACCKPRCFGYNPEKSKLKSGSQQFMATILSIASTEVLKRTRQLLLEHKGFTVRSALTLAEVEALGKNEKVDLALIGHGFRAQEKRKIAQAVNQFYPGLPILEMCVHSPEIPGSDFILSDSPHDLIAAIGIVLEGRRVRGYTE